MAAQQQQQQHALQGVDPPPPIALRLHTPEDEENAYRDLRYEPDRNGFPIPKKANKIESTWLFDKEKDTTGLVLGDLLKRSIFHQNNLVADKRREMLKVMTSSKKKKKHLNHLGSQLKGLMYRLQHMLTSFEDDILNVVLEMPEYFKTPPKIE